MNNILDDLSLKLSLYLFDNETINRSFIDSDLFLNDLVILMNLNKTKTIIHPSSVKFLIKSIKINNKNNVVLNIPEFVTKTNINYYNYSNLIFRLPLITEVNNNYVEEKICFEVETKLFNYISDNINDINLIDNIITQFKLNDVKINKLKFIEFSIMLLLNNNNPLNYKATYHNKLDCLTTRDVLGNLIEHIIDIKGKLKND
jgi:hypothetical protein